ncbi:MAG: hypothetical protein M1831_002196 [Alyxoria varia]|nr:MAG: hypothetical protein M1831_002196 [Alyxoria varia]
MASKASDNVLKRPLYVFDLPPEILGTLEPVLNSNASFESEESNQSENGAPKHSSQPAEDGALPKATSCALCGLSFENVEEQRHHVRSDLHAYNLKQKTKGIKPVTEAEFEKLVEELDESLSGSDSSDSGSDSENDNPEAQRKTNGTTLDALLKRQANISDEPEDDFSSSEKRRRGAGNPPLIWFKSAALPSDTALGIWRTLFPATTQQDPQILLSALQSKQHRPHVPKPNPPDGGVALQDIPKGGPQIFMCMIGGGHFAGMIVSLTPKLARKQGVEERQASVLAHKTFHRYTTRRKQGGAQSANDSAKGAAHSAGSSLRRYNEQALVDDVRSLLAEWRAMIDGCELVFIRATGSTNRRTLFGPYDGQVLRQNDPRNRGFPFSTRRATQNELMRCFVELTRAKTGSISEITRSADKEKSQGEIATSADAKKQQQQQQQQHQKEPPKPALTPEQATAQLHTNQIIALIKRSKIPALLSYLQTNDIHLPTFRFFSSPDDTSTHHHAPTPLHLAASNNNSALVTALLMRGGADPSVRNGDERTPYEITRDRGTRDAFRIVRFELGEDARDWARSSIPAGISKTEAENRIAQEKAEESQKESKRRQEGLQQLKEEETKKERERRERGEEKFEKKMGKGKSLMSAREPRTAEERRQEESKGMSEEMVRRLERERRARAAEERMKRL